MKFGVKTYDNEDFLDYFLDKADFFEVQAIRGKDYSFLQKFAGKIPMVIHAEHQGFGVNAADSTLEKVNLESINFAIKVADLAKADYIVFHPGIINNKNCSIDNSIKFLKKIKDKRIILENLPMHTKEIISIGSKPEEMKKLMRETGFGFCFDINHSIEAAIFYNLDIKYLILEFEKLNPKHYHLGGQKIKEKKTHLSLSESDFDLLSYLKLLNKNAEITLETTTDVNDVEEDLKSVKNFSR